MEKERRPEEVPDEEVPDEDEPLPRPRPGDDVEEVEPRPEDPEEPDVVVDEP